MVELFELFLIISAICLSRSLRSSLYQWADTFKGTERWVATMNLLLTPLVGCLVISAILHKPVPRVHDEFSYMLMADTFASGHIANSTPPLLEFFDTFHVLMRPAYVSKYFPMQGLFLAVGQMLTGQPAVGLWLSSALACVATYWMLLAWTGPSWALLGGFLMVVQYGIYSYWSQTYWGGMATALGGAIFFGAARCLWDDLSWKNAAWLGVGVVILVNSRPLEGILAMLPLTGVLLIRVFREREWKRPEFWRSLVLPAGLVLVLGAAATCSYNHAITGSYFKTPYMLHEQQYQESPFLSFLPLRPKLTYSSPWVQYYYEVRETMLYQLPRDPKIFVSVVARRFATWWSFYCGVLLTPALLFPILLRPGRIRLLQIGVLAGLVLLFAISGPMSTGLRLAIDALVVVQIVLLWITFDGFWQRLALSTCCLLMLEGLIVKLFFAHYFAPAASLILFLQVDGLKRLWHWRAHGDAPASKLTRTERRRAARASAKTHAPTHPLQGFVTLLPLVCVICLGMRVEARINGWSEDPHGPDRKALLTNDWSLRRAELEHWLEQQPTPQLVFVRYSSRHNVIFEWVYNRADLIHSRVVWARNLGAEHNRLLLKQFPDRTVWLVDADRRDPQLILYSEIDAKAPTPIAAKAEPGTEQDQLGW